MNEDRRRRLESVIPELLKRVVELGVEKAVEAPDNIKELVGGIKLPREAAQYLLSQVDDTKSGIFRVVAKEVREFLAQTNVSGEMQKMLSTMQLEIRTTIRFKPSVTDGGVEGERSRLRADVKSDVQVKRASRSNDRGESTEPGVAFGTEDRPRERRRSRE
jgi:hypothetical protein